MNFDRDMLRVGDALLYYGSADPRIPSRDQNAGFIDLAIATKTSGRVSHIELYAGDGISQASRNGIGVNRYALRLPGLVAVRRPKVIFDWGIGEHWFDSSARGQKYDFLGLMCFYLAVKRGSPDRMFCSEFALRRYRHSNFQPFNPDHDSDRTSPFDFWKCGNMDTVWQKKGFSP